MPATYAREMAYAVVTREPEQALPYAQALAPLGLEVIAMPVTRVEAPRDTRALSRALAGPAHRFAVVASARAAQALVEALATHDGALPVVWAVGPATARVLELAGIPAIVPGDARTGATLAAALVAHGVAGARVLVPRAEDGRDDAIAMLRDAGAIVDDVIAYRTVTAAPPPEHRGREALRDPDALCIVFAPSQVSALVELFGLPAIRARFAAIGETTATALREAGADPVAIAQTPTPEGIANAIAAVLSRSP